MSRYYSANSVLFSLIILSSIGITLFLNKGYIIVNENISQNNYINYLAEKMWLIEFQKINKEQECSIQKKPTTSLNKKHLTFSFHCQFHSIFIQPKPTKEKYILVENINDWLDINAYQHVIYPIASLDDLPESSEENPKIVRITQNIDGRLMQPFYGIVITDYLFNFTDQRIYGTIYSSNNANDPNRRNLSYKRNVIQNIERDYSNWRYLPKSANTLNHENN
ncbi:DUF2572 family protein [Bibersteinia trehalosi]|uniref:DUF2572 family protein n=1 Tax=Bibersteinia trehalosi TaxID=47735 RepID=UPI0040463BAB